MKDFEVKFKFSEYLEYIGWCFGCIFLIWFIKIILGGV